MTIPYEDDRITVCHGDCLDVLTALPDEGIDAVITDPPYALSFMSKDWDAIHPNPQIWKECWRLLKPGGHLLSFGGTRTFHRLTCDIEDAGFEIRDSIAWLYGCHDDQTEVLTRRGWVNGLDLIHDDEVAQWAIDGTVTLVRPNAQQRYNYDGQMVRFRNADVDQLVTPNHRVYRQVFERTQVTGVRTSSWSDWRVDQAADINRWQPMRLPAAGTHNGVGIGETDYAALLGWIWSDGGFDLSGSGVRIYQSSVNQSFVDEISALLDRIGSHKRYDYQREWRGRGYTSSTWFISGALAHRVRADLPGKAPSWELLWRMTTDEKRALWDAAMKGDGSKKSKTFWQKDRAALEWSQALLAGIGCRGIIADDPRGVLHWTNRSTVELQARHLSDRSETYTGEVWCVTVSSGAFLVRRNGRVSVSGNSGFPKSTDISKQIDKLAGAEREVVGSRLGIPGVSKTGANLANGFSRELEGREDRPSAALEITAPATDDAKKWEGWGSALKPAWEPIIVARKPLKGTLARNVLAYGTGGLNIAATRVQYEEGGSLASNPSLRESINGGNGGNIFPTETDRRVVIPNTAGRWPPNVVLDESQAEALDAEVGYQKDGVAVNRNKSVGAHSGNTIYGARDQDTKPDATYGSGGGPSRFFPVMKYQAKAPKKERPNVNGIAHPTTKPLELMKWLVRLVTPPGGWVLDPFAGSGTTGEAALAEGMNCVLIEREADYIPLILARIERSKP